MIKAMRRLSAAVALSLVAFKAVGSFLSWIERQDNSLAETWIDEEEYEQV